VGGQTGDEDDMNEQPKINIPAIITQLRLATANNQEEAETTRLLALQFAQRVEVLVTRLDELELAEVYRIFDELGVVL